MKIARILASVLAVLFCSFPVFANDNAVGNKILGAGVTPKGPGFNYITEADYRFGNTKDPDGNKVGKFREFANVHVFEYVTPYKLLGAMYSLDVAVPLVSVQILDEDGNKLDKATGMADVSIEPLTLSWPSKYVDSKFTLTFNTPTGGATSKDHWATIFTGAFSIFFNEARTLELALIPTYEIHSDKLNDNVKKGDDFIIRYGLGYTFGPNQIGIHGYSVFHVTDDKGTPRTDDAGKLLFPANADLKKAGKENYHGAGIQYQRWLDTVKANFNFMFTQEFGAKGANEGTRFHITLVKPM